MDDNCRNCFLKTGFYCTSRFTVAIYFIVLFLLVVYSIEQLPPTDRFYYKFVIVFYHHLPEQPVHGEIRNPEAREMCY